MDNTNAKKYLNMAMTVIFVATFLAIFYFTYACDVEKDVVEEQMNFLVDDFTSQAYLINNKTKLDIVNKLNNVNIDLSAVDNEVDVENDAVKKKAMIAIGLFNIIGLYTIYYYCNQYNIDFMHLVKDNLIIIFFVAMTEFVFLNLFVRKFISIDPNLIKLNILNKFA
ncbi:hypothetical protein BMW23_0984 [Bodo saltans virus]|uniref:Uncharacterized protein n=1 Tax=Bodo saltans virus TaxID=2024608 RepID=A0A2H4UWG0_9VIRU|nr:hypothetical protein QJ851_gp0966 [Bodo saltans virus]ATZ81029.1 hypothetical protein BMW23_0984 [Bodo saltans virus]